MKPLLSLLIPLFLLAPAANADDQSVKAIELYKNCKEALRYFETGTTTNTIGVSYCVGYVKGATEMMAVMSTEAKDKYNACMGLDEITTESSIKILVDFLERNPSTMDMNPLVVLMTSHVSHYNCDK